MKSIRIDFVDFWPQLKKTDNYFYNGLKKYYEVKIDSKNPDLIFYSVFGEKNLEYRCKRIFYSGENIKPNFNICDFAFAFNHIKNKKYFRLPLYSIYYFDYIDNKYQKQSIEKENWIKRKDCCMVVSNEKAKKRIDFFKKLSNFISVDSGGAVLNNVGGKVKDKLKFIENYKFVLAFENEMSDGYTTEKILEPIMRGCIPIYWGNKRVDLDFNKNRFLDYSDFKNEEELISKIVEISNESNLALNIINQPYLSNNRFSFEVERKIVINKIVSVIESNNKPIAKSITAKIIFLILRYRGTRILKYTKLRIKRVLGI